MKDLNQKVVNTPTPAPGSLGKGELYAISLGQVIGVGVIILVGPMIQITGYSVWLAYALAVVLGFVSLLPYVFVTSALRFGAGIYSFVASTLDYRMAGLLSISFLPTTLGMASLALSFGLYVNSLLPGISPQLAGIVIICLFVSINWFGINTMAKIQKYASWLLLGALLLFVIVGVFKLDNKGIFDVMADDFMATGDKGFIAAIATFMYSTVGYSLTMSYGKDAKNAKRDIPWAFVATAVSLLVLYTGVAIVATGVLPLEQVAGKPLTVAARAILPTPLFVLFMIGGPMTALITTINASIAYYQMPFRQACIDGWFPESWNKNNKYGACVPMLMIVLLSGVLPQLFNFSIVNLTNNLQLMTSSLAFIYFIAFFRFPTKHAEAWKRSHLHINNVAYYIIISISLAVQIFIFYNSIRSLTPRVVIISIIALVICMAYGFFRAKSPKVQIKTSTWED